MPVANKYLNNDIENVEDTNNSKIREKRPPFKYKSGAIYDGEWVGNKRDG